MLSGLPHDKSLRMAKFSHLGMSVGILGGGQLALMLADSAIQMGLKPVVLAESSDSPAAQVCPDVVFGSLGDEQALFRFFSQVDQVIFENEFVDCALLKRIASGFGTQFFPSLEALCEVQDKLNQKRLLSRLSIPTAEFYVLDFQQNLKTQLTAVLEKLGGSCVLKWSRQGYDGKGVLLVDQLNAKISAFCDQAKGKQSLVYAEKQIRFRRELAMIGVLSKTGEFLNYPLVISEQKEGVCSRVYGPAVSLGVSPQIEELAKDAVRRIGESLGIVGTFAVEFFLDVDENLWVNEIAPRVHNSGHFTQDACLTDQFENHWRAVLGIPLGGSFSSPGFAMLNFLGPENSLLDTQPMPEVSSRTVFHWYHKKGVLPRRKLGHLNGRVNSPSEIEALLKELDASYNQWSEELSHG